MVIDEGGLAGLLKRAYRNGYDIVMDENTVVFMGNEWLVEVPRADIPRKVLGTMVEHMGMLPETEAAMTVCRDRDNQEIIPDAAWGTVREWKETRQGSEAVVLPLGWGGAQLYQAHDQRIVGVASDLLRVLDHANAPPLILDGDRAMWTGDGQVVIAKGYHPFSGLSAERWGVLEGIDWSRKDE